MDERGYVGEAGQILIDGVRIDDFEARMAAEGWQFGCRKGSWRGNVFIERPWRTVKYRRCI
jgi:hypothetical protein